MFFTQPASQTLKQLKCYVRQQTGKENYLNCRPSGIKAKVAQYVEWLNVSIMIGQTKPSAS